MLDNILIPTDGSENAGHAVDYGLTLAELCDAKVHALYVVETRATYIITADLKGEEMEEYREYGKEAVTEIVNEAEERGLEARGVVKAGKIAEEVIDYSNDKRVDTIVIGKQGYGALGKYIGGTAEKVANMADIPVTTVGSGYR